MRGIRLLCLAALLILIGLPGTSFGEFYRYIDENGVQRFTDNLAEVPRDQRPGAVQYEGVDDNLTPAEVTQKRKVRKNSRTARRGVEENASQGAVAQEMRKLRTMKSDLDKEYAELKAIEKNLDEERASVKSPAEMEVYNAQVRSLNARTREYQKKVDEYQKQVRILSKPF